MSKTSILVISGQRAGSNSALKAWAQIPHPFHLNTAESDEAAIELFHKQPFDLVIVDYTDSSVDNKKLNAVLPILQEDITLLPYQGETETELEDQVKAILFARKYLRARQRILLLEHSTESSFLNLPPFSLN